MENRQVFSPDITVASYFELKLNGEKVELLPFGHARHFPLTYNFRNKNVLVGELNFFNTVLFNNLDFNKFIDTDLCELIVSKSKKELVILNILDNCFGHSLLKLFYSINCIESHQSNFDFLVIIPQALYHFILPKKGVSFLKVNQSFTQLQECYVLNKEIEKLTSVYSNAFIVGTETYTSFNHELLKEKLALFGNEKNGGIRNKVIFYYRADYYRMWNGRRQRGNINKLFDFLKPYFNGSVEFTVVGDSDDVKFPDWIHDKRVKAFTKEIDFQYNHLFETTLICIGLTGSHMIFPSLLSSCSVHLHPVFKYKNMAEDIVVKENSNEMMSAYKHLYYHGNHNCSDLTPQKLGRLILIHFLGLVEKQYKIGNDNVSQKEWVAEQYPQFNYRLANDFRLSENKIGNRKIAIQSKIERLFNFVKL